jgi:hypothetical protein
VHRAPPRLRIRFFDDFVGGRRALRLRIGPVERRLARLELVAVVGAQGGENQYVPAGATSQADADFGSSAADDDIPF